LLRVTSVSPPRRPRGLFAALLGATALLLLAHAWHYRFLTDDAYISFRYARNLARGYGLVFNPGFERVEGYTNFLWVLLLAGANAAGLSMEHAAFALSGLATLGLWAVVARFAWRLAPRGRRIWILLPLLLLAATRSVAVWSSSGLETRLFELLVAAGSLRLWSEDERLGRGERGVWPFAALLFGLASLARPDGVLISACAFAAVAAWRGRSLASRGAWLGRSAAAYVALVGAHFAFRYAYYGAWLPNTYYAKVDGRLWWSSGLEYLLAFVLEYGIWLWIPFLVAGALSLRRGGAALVPVLFAAIVLPHALYIVAIGGDHFEYRPFDLYFPYAYLLIGCGALWMARGARATAAVLAGVAALAVGIAELPRQSAAQFPEVYLPGFPGVVIANRAWSIDQGPAAARAEDYLAPDRSLVYRLPGLRAIAEVHQLLIRSMTQRFVGIRQEEHRLFLDTARAQGMELARLVADGRIPADAYVATDCVGAIPYFSGLRVLDRLGLTDARVARGPLQNRETMAHGKHASLARAREDEVDLWALDDVYLLWDPRDPALADRAVRALLRGAPGYAAPVGDGLYLMAELPRGAVVTQQRFPALHFRSARDPGLLAELAHELARSAPRSASARTALAAALRRAGELDEAAAQLRGVLALAPGDAVAHHELAVVLLRQGKRAEAVSLLEEAVRRIPDPTLYRDLGEILMRQGKPALATTNFERALRLAPGDAALRGSLERARAQERLRERDGEN
jgi:hypothetical protein